MMRFLVLTVALWCSCACAQVPMTGAGLGAPGGGGPSFSITYESTGVNTSSGTSDNFGTLSYGASPSVVLAIVCAFQNTATAVTSATINGVSATQVSGFAVTGAANRIDAWYAVAPGGSSGNVTFNYNGSLGGAQDVVSLFNIQTTTTTPSSGANASNNNASSLNQSITVPSGGGGVAGFCNQAFSSQTFTAWTNATAKNAQTGTLSMAVGAVNGTGAVSVTGTISANDADAMGLVSWAP